MERQCTPAEIAEKRRLALERQQQRKAGNKLPENPKQPQLSAEQKNLIEQNRLRAIEIRKAKAAEAGAVKKASNVPPPASTSSAVSSDIQLEWKKRIEQHSLGVMEFIEAKFSANAKPSAAFTAALGKADSALKVANSNRQHPYLPNQNQKPAVPVAPPKPKIPVICSFEIISDLRFEARTDKYDETVINSFKKIKSKNFYPPSTWSFNLSDYESLITELATIKGYVTPKPVAPVFLRFFRDPTPVPDKSCLQFIEPVLEESLKDFQRDGVCFGISREGRFMLADDPGLGKTRQALAVADYYKADFPLLIVTPAAVRDFWRDQIFELLPSVNILDVATIDANNKDIGLAKVVISSYNGISSHLEKLKARNFGVVIFDESHRLKEHGSKQTINATILGKQAVRVILISGTPALSRPRELYSQLAIIDNRLKSFPVFAERYCEGKNGKFGLEANGACNLNELKALLSKRFMIRRTKDDVFSELGAKERIIIELPEPKGEAINTQLRQFSQEFYGAKSKKQERELLIQWYTQTAALKADLVCSYIEEFVKKSKEKFLIFGHHRVVLNAIQGCLFQLGVKFVRLDGDTKPEKRDEYVQQFQLDGDTRCALLSLKACSVGITLTAASVVIFAELHWTPSDIVQAEGRVHRIGQDKQVKCYFLLAPGTADDVMWRMLHSKQKNIGKAGLFSDNEHFSGDIVRTKFEPQASTSTSTQKKTITDHFEVATTPRKSDEMDTSDSFLTCRTSFDEEFLDEAANNQPNLNVSTPVVEGDFLDMPSFRSQLPESNNNQPGAHKVNPNPGEPKQSSQPGKSTEVPKEQSHSEFDDDDDAILLEAEKILLEAEEKAKEEMRKRQERAEIDELADIVFSDEE